MGDQSGQWQNHAFQSRPPPPNYGMQAMPSHRPPPPGWLPHQPGQQQPYYPPGSAPPRPPQPPPPPGAPTYSQVMRPQHVAPHQQPNATWQNTSVALQPGHFMQPLVHHHHGGGGMHMASNTNFHQYGGSMVMQPHHMRTPIPFTHSLAIQQQQMMIQRMQMEEQQRRQKHSPTKPPQQQQQQQPPSKKQKKKDQVLPVEKMTVDPVVRPPASEAEAKEIEAWKAERRKNWPTEENLDRKEREATARQQRGELDLVKEERTQRLKDVLHQQRAMGLTRKAGTEELLQKLSRQSSQGRGGGGNRGRGGSRGGRGGRQNNNNGRNAQSGWEGFVNGGDVALPADDVHVGNKRKASDWEQPNDEGVHEDGQGLAALACYGSDIDDIKQPPAAQNEAPTRNNGDVDIDTGVQQRGRGGRGRGGRRERGGRQGFEGGRGRHKMHQQQRSSRPKPPSLLEKLLAKEIRQDRSYILQAIRFFVNNNFLLDLKDGVPLKFPEVAATSAAPPAPKPTSLAEVLAQNKDLVVDDDEDLLEEEGNQQGDGDATPDLDSMNNSMDPSMNTEEREAYEAVREEEFQIYKETIYHLRGY